MDRFRYTRPHRVKLEAALRNQKCSTDFPLIQQCISTYDEWITKMENLFSKGEERVVDLVDLLNWYKNTLEVDLIMRKGSPFLRRQKGQLKLDNTVLEEFMMHLINPNILHGIDELDKLFVGPQKSFMSLAFFPNSFKELLKKPNVILKTKDQDFIMGVKLYYKIATSPSFVPENTVDGAFILSVLAAECKVNLDKTMFQEAAGTSARLKQGCPVSKYFVLVEYLDMEPEDTRLTAIDNVFLLRHSKRLTFEQRDNVVSVENQHKNYPIDTKVILNFVKEIQSFIDATLYDPESALKRGSFV